MQLDLELGSIFTAACLGFGLICLISYLVGLSQHPHKLSMWELKLGLGYSQLIPSLLVLYGEGVVSDVQE